MELWLNLKTWDHKGPGSRGQCFHSQSIATLKKFWNKPIVHENTWWLNKKDDGLQFHKLLKDDMIQDDNSIKVFLFCFYTFLTVLNSHEPTWNPPGIYMEPIWNPNGKTKSCDDDNVWNFSLLPSTVLGAMTCSKTSGEWTKGSHWSKVITFNTRVPQDWHLKTCMGKHLWEATVVKWLPSTCSPRLTPKTCECE